MAKTTYLDIINDSLEIQKVYGTGRSLLQTTAEPTSIPLRGEVSFNIPKLDSKPKKKLSYAV
jgi:hypothetical protein